jgi:hypothetical protein
MYDDLNKLILLKNEDIYNDKTIFVETDYYCKINFPNTIVNGYEYFN